MKSILIILIVVISMSFLFSFFKSNQIDISNYSNSFYDYSALSIDGNMIDMSEYKGKKILIVNVASKCGYTPQYEQLQELYDNYGDKIIILGFPSNDFLFQEPLGEDQIKTFCSTRYGVTFPMFSKIVVKNKKTQAPLYSWLSNIELNGVNDTAPSWNFCKYLIDENGRLIKYFNSKVNPMDTQIIDLIINE